MAAAGAAAPRAAAACRRGRRGALAPLARRAAEEAAAAARVLLVGGSGGWAARRLGAPLPWVLGSAAAALGASALGAPPRLPRWLQLSMQVLMGTILGSTFRPDFLESLWQSAGSVAALLLLSTAGTLVVAAYLRRAVRCDRTTALFAAAPGGLNDMMAIGTELGGDPKAIGLLHVCRLLSVTYLLPLALRVVAPAAPGSALPPPRIGPPALAAARPGPAAAAGPAAWGTLLLCAALGPACARRLPAGCLLGPMVLCALAGVAGIPAAAPPRWSACAAQAVLGAGLGARLGGSGARPREAARIFAVGLGATTILLAMALSFSLVMSQLQRASSWQQLLLCFSPGGMPEMCMVAMTLGFDVSVVATHHMLRILFLVACLPFVARARARGGRPPAAAAARGGGAATGP